MKDLGRVSATTLYVYLQSRANRFWDSFLIGTISFHFQDIMPIAPTQRKQGIKIFVRKSGRVRRLPWKSRIQPKAIAISVSQDVIHTHLDYLKGVSSSVLSQICPKLSPFKLCDKVCCPTWVNVVLCLLLAGVGHETEVGWWSKPVASWSILIFLKAAALSAEISILAWEI